MFYLNRFIAIRFIIFQKNLKKNTNVKITNLINGKYIIATVGKKTLYPNFYNSVLSPRISKELEIDLDEALELLKQRALKSKKTNKKATKKKATKKKATKKKATKKKAK